MVGKGKVPDAWDDDWESAADKTARDEEEAEQHATPPPPMTKAQRLAKHAESNRKLWESAEAPPEPSFFVANSASSNVPLAAGFKPAMKVLSRKPAPQMIARRDPVTGIEQLTIQDDGDDDDADAQKSQPTPEEIRRRQQRELEEKQRRYEEARAKIFGESASSNSSSKASRPSTPGSVTPPQSAEGRPNHRGKGRGRGGAFRNDSHGRTESQGRRPGSQPAGRELYDPGYLPKPGFTMQKRGGDSSSPARASTPKDEDQVIRGPRGPDGSGRGGFGFARRGAKED
ncbi:hypothetical protein NKR23_g56 [Pleurostoma richardsiae]|uniref:SUZ RNA-binding domain-containing n=1 Tax=Pleurostoma richardsiae TaxID=41990 RepID=A0AA38RV24_9PEZI|nr:hypothetical protein NKR23_g56 [Pleurostoma richardsiae]